MDGWLILRFAARNNFDRGAGILLRTVQDLQIFQPTAEERDHGKKDERGTQKEERCGR